MKLTIAPALTLAALLGPGCADDDSSPIDVADADGDGEASREDAGVEDVPGPELTDDAPPPDDACGLHCANGVRDCGESGVDCGGACAPCEPVRLLDDDFRPDSGCPDGCCVASCTRTVEAGTPTAGGWSADGADSRIVYDLGRPVDCGSVLVHVDDFNPYYQYQSEGATDEYVEFIAMFDGLDGELNHNTHGSQFDMMNTPCPGCTPADGDLSNRCRVKVATGLITTDPSCDWENWLYARDLFCPGDPAVDPTWNPQSLEFEVRWSVRGLVYYINGAEQGSYAYGVFPNDCYPEPKTPQLRYLTLGRPRLASGGGWLLGPRYTNVELVEYDCTTIEW